MESNVFDENEIIDGGTVELSPELDKMITAKIKQAMDDLDQNLRISL